MEKSPLSRWRRRSICTKLLAWRRVGRWRDLRNCMILMCEFVVTAVIMGVGLQECMQEISLLSIAVHLEYRGVTRLQRGRSKVV